MSLSYELGYDLLGPIFRFFFYRLRLIEQFKPETPFLFLSRGGLRMRYFYQQYLDVNGLAHLAPKRDFYISRMAAFRALLADRSEFAATEVAHEYSYQTVTDSMRYFLPEAVFQKWQSAASELAQENRAIVSADYLESMLKGALPHALIFQEHVNEQRTLLNQYFRDLRGSQKEVVLVDTGWSGSIVRSLQDLFPDTAFTAVFFGRFNYGKPPPPWFNSIFGTILQQEHYDRSIPQSCFVFHRHLIESLCEPDWPSVESYCIDSGQVVPSTGLMPEALKAPGEVDVIARAVNDFLLAEPATSPTQVILDYDLAIKRLAKIITYPNKQEAIALGMRPRSLDFGRSKSIPVLLDTSGEGTKLHRIIHSLWLQGQVALEFDFLRLPVQFAITWDDTLHSNSGWAARFLRKMLRNAYAFFRR